MKTIPSRNARGFSLIEVMIAVIVLAVGLLALAVLQGELFRSGAEAKARANAATIAQQVIEDARTFGFVSAPDAAYTGNTYNSLADDEWTVEGVSGIDYTVTRTVTRYRFDPDEGADGEFVVNTVDPFSLAVPEFKMVRVVVGWTDNLGDEKQIQMADSIAAISPADVAKVMQGPGEEAAGPQVWIEPPNKDNPRVVPIAIGDNESAASSNPTPQQFVEDVSAVTRFQVMSFTGQPEDDEVLVTRKLDMAAASCICQDEGEESSSLNLAYGPTVWNGVQLAYTEPEAITGAPIGSAVVANADSEVEPICTICCRDHHVDADRSPTPDPWRAGTDSDPVSAHYGYKKTGSSFDLDGGLLPTSDTDGLYLDACQLTRVAGKMRMTVDAMQTALVTTALDESGTGYELTSFADLFSDYVTDLLKTGLGSTATMPDGYPGPAAIFPRATSALDLEHATLTDPAAVDIAEDQERTLVSFGVYVDYLSDETLTAYKCALDGDNEGDCTGLGERNPLEVLPFYAINVASLGDWVSSTPLAASVADATYSNQGTLQTNGGLVTGEKAGSEDPIPVTLTIGNSNSGLTGTTAVDFDDDASANRSSDAQDFNKTDGTDPQDPPNELILAIDSASSINNLGALGFLSNQTPSTCNPQNGSKEALCYFEDSVAGMTVTISNYTSKKQGQNTVYAQRSICVPAGVTAVRNTTGMYTMAETTTIYMPTMGNVNYTMEFAVVDGLTCSATIVAGLTSGPTP
jgi:prepilin-type N-terminal cleavage/methylation domain-containing protein